MEKVENNLLEVWQGTGNGTTSRSLDIIPKMDNTDEYPFSVEVCQPSQEVKVHSGLVEGEQLRKSEGI